MAQRKVFIDEQGKQLVAYILKSGELYIEIKDDDDNLSYVSLTAEDANDLIMSLYRIRKDL